MKVKIISKKETYDTYKTMLEKAGFEISSDASITLKEDDFIQESFIGELEGAYEIIHFSKIVYIESFGHNIILHTLKESYKIREKLYEVEGILSEKPFIRISKSVIVNKHGIAKIRPSLNGRIELDMKNQSKIYVSKGYAKLFKEFIGF